MYVDSVTLRHQSWETAAYIQQHSYCADVCTHGGFMKFVRGPVAMLAALVTLVSVVTACTHTSATKTAASPAPNPSQVNVANGAAATLRLSDGARVTLGAGATSGTGTLTAAVQTNPGAAPSGLQQTGRV